MRKLFLLQCLCITFTIIAKRVCTSGPCDLCDPECSASTVSLSSSVRCRCDAACTTYGDCCGGERPQCPDDDPGATTSPLLQGLECRRTENIFLDVYYQVRIGLRESYWMVSACPDEWLASADAQRREVNANCTSSEFPFPPVSDNSTGIVYKNEYCAVCNGVESAVHWRHVLGCTEWLGTELLRGFQLNLDVIARECIPCSFEPPQQPYLASKSRACYPHVDSCLGPEEVEMSPENYAQAVLWCASKPFNPVWPHPGGTVYRNEHCALCNGEPMTKCAPLPGATFPGVLIPKFGPSLCAELAERRLGQQLRPPSTIPNGTHNPLIRATPFSAVLDIGNSGVQVSTSIVATQTVPVTCDVNQRYDPALQGCRSIVCPEVFNNDSQGGCTFTTVCETGLIQLTDDDDFKLLDNSTVVYSDTEYNIVRYLEGNPVICANLSRNGTLTRNITDIFYSYPRAYFVLTYVGCSLSLAGVIIILLSLALFNELRTLTTMILANLSVSVVITNLFILIGGPVAEATESRSLCVSVSIVLHFFFLAHFTWMTIMSVEIACTLIRGARLQLCLSSKESRRMFLVYFLIGWSIPLAIVVTTLIVNFNPSTSHLVLYGRLEDGQDGLCWLNHKTSAILAFIVPISVSLLVNLTLLVVISVILIQAVGNHMNLKHSAPYAYLRVYAAVFFSSGATWVFGFVALVADRDWAWYPFIILNSVQGFLLFIAFMLTRKVAILYLFLFSCGRLDYRSTTTVQTSGKLSSRRSSGNESNGSTKMKLKTENGTLELQDSTDSKDKSIDDTKLDV